MRAPKYLAFLRQQHCEACILMANGDSALLRGYSRICGVVQAAHGPVNGMSSKGPDNEAVPLGLIHHQQQHRLGWPAFEERHGFNRAEVAKAHYERFEREGLNG